MPKVALSLPARAFGAPDLAHGSVLFVGTATVLLRYAGFTILTDPNFLHAGDPVHLGFGLTSKRLTEPALNIDELPPMDFCVLSHDHGDHFDRIAEAKLPRHLPILTTHRAAAKLSRKGFASAWGLSTWETAAVEKGRSRLVLTAMPAKHGPSLVSPLLPAVMGCMLDFQDAYERTRFRVYITGDTLLHDALHEIPRRFPRIDLALVHLGGTRILGMPVSMDAAQGVKAMQIIRPRMLIPIHYDDYGVFKSPLRDFQTAVQAAGLGEGVRYLRRGKTYAFEVEGAALRRAQ